MTTKDPISGDTNIILHGTSSLENLKSIVKKGFFPSYTAEEFAGRKHRILMVSFSDVPLHTINSQIDYGQYIIGVSREWAFESKLQPVVYTYRGSEFERKITDLIEISVAGHSILPFIMEHKNKGVPFSSETPLFKPFINLAYTDNFSDTHSNELIPVFGKIYEAAHSIYHYAKNHIVRMKDGSLRTAFNDREWRYIPPKGLENDSTLIFETDAAGNPDERYQFWSKDKPHGTDIPLPIDIKHIRYLIVKTPEEAKEIRLYLEQLYTKELVNELMEKKLLQINYTNTNE